MEDKESKAFEGLGTGDIVLGDKIDNRGGTLIKHVEHFHQGNDQCSVFVPVEEEQTDVLDPQPVVALIEKENFLLNPIDRSLKAIKAVIDAGLMKNDYYYAALYKVITEQKGMESFSYTDIEHMVIDCGALEAQDVPKSNSFRKIIIKGSYPNWVINAKGYEPLKDMLNIAKTYLEEYQN